MDRRFEKRLNLLNDFINSATLDSDNKAVLKSFSQHLLDFFKDLSKCIGETQLLDEEAIIVEDMCLHNVKLHIYPPNPVNEDLEEAVRCLKKANKLEAFQDLIKRHKDIIIFDLHKVKCINEDLYNQIIFK